MFSICTSFPAIQFSVVHRQKYLGKKKAQCQIPGGSDLPQQKNVACCITGARCPGWERDAQRMADEAESIKFRGGGARNFSSPLPTKTVEGNPLFLICP